MSITQSDIAKHLGISQVLVSYALKGNPRVNEKTRQLILATAEDLGYDARSNNVGRALAARRNGKRLRTGVIAVAFPFQSSSELRSIPYYGAILDGMQDEATKRGVEICLCPIRTNEIPYIIREQSVDGVILLSRGLPMPQDIAIPKVNLQWYSEGAHCVCPDDREAGRLAALHLLELGHRRIAFMGILCADDLPSERRLAGYRDVMNEYGIEVREEWIAKPDFGLPICVPSADRPGCGECASCMGWAELVDRNRNEKGSPDFTAIICYNDHMAMGVVNLARKAGIRVPRDLSVIGFDDISSAYHFQPALTSVKMSLYEMGADSIRIVQDIMETGGDTGVEYQQHILPVSLVVRDSTAKPAIG